jgi:hypothetical protein
MYKIVAIASIAIALGGALPAYAEAPFLESSSGASANALGAAQSAAGAVSSSNGGAGGAVIFNNPGNSRQEIVTSGTQTIRSAPQVVAPSMSSGHPCAWAPVSIGVSVVGFGGAFGGQRIDDACLLAQMGVPQAAVLMIAARNPSACRALMAVGRVASCGGQRAASAAAPAPRYYTKKTTTASMVNPAPRYIKVSSLKKGQLYRKNGKLYRKG